ncbi:RagB/SusD family nutrient uptake outer membrane protein [Pedobacter heparinus]|uniref:RagB/SusD family nutrient uptake outer membrane protein n=1 Tax=Pedobacter heparinus TaxID=984 RepID=UPI00292D8ABA|nr:RagB/SusD family nutrient uptake outer membrane protein [Pedobacter heparinus]
MKNIIYLLLSLCLLSACKVDRISETNLSDGSFWKSEDDLKAATNYLYTFLPGLFITTDNWSDDGYATAPNPISDGSRLVPATTSDFSTPYQLIRAACNIIEKAPLAEKAGVPAATVNIYVAEARFFRAWAYFQLVQKFGDVPLILSSLKEDSPELMGPRTPREQIYDAIYEDLNFAISKLPTPTARGAVGYGRITNTAALAFEARAALFEGTRAKFHQDGNPGKHLGLAVTAAKKVIDGGEHGIFSNYFGLFQYAGEGPQNKENILVRQYGKSTADDISSYNCGTLVNGATNATKALVDAYLMKDGLPIEISPRYTPPTTFTKTFVDRDERLNATIMKPGDLFLYGAPFQNPSLIFHTTGFCPRKFVDSHTVGNGVTFIDYPIIRYAEVLLIYAEALYELNGSISDTELNESINRLRPRAGLPNLSNAFVQTHGLDMRNELRRERRVELAMEGFRYWDLIRWKTAETELKKNVLGSYFFASEPGFATTKPNLTPDNYILVQAAAARKFDVGKDYLWPLPLNEIALNPQLKQNPGWK